MNDRPAPGDAARPLDPTLDFLRLLWSIEHHLQSTSKRMEARLGITGPQRLVLRVVAEYPGISPKEVAHVVRLHPSTITGIIQRLTKKGLLLRARDPIDTRRVRLRIQPAGRRFTQRATGTVEHAVEHALKRVPAASVRAAREVLAAIGASLESF
jgi:DNA-binding MarR family transcriptional regulator